MILLHNEHDRISREFCEKYKDHFSKILNYEESTKLYSVSHFPAAVLPVPAMVKDNSLYATMKRVPNYRRLGNTVKMFHTVHNQYGCSAGKTLVDQYVIDKKFKEEDLWWLVQACNDPIIPAHQIPGVIWWASKNMIVDLGIDCPVDLDLSTKTRSTKSIDEKKDLIEIKPPTIEIIYPKTIDECYKRLQDFDTWKEKVGPQE